MFFLCACFFLCQVPFLPLCICSLAWNFIYQLYIKLMSSTILREVLHRPTLTSHIKLCHQLLGLNRRAQTQQFNWEFTKGPVSARGWEGVKEKCTVTNWDMSPIPYGSLCSEQLGWELRYRVLFEVHWSTVSSSRQAGVSHLIVSHMRWMHIT